jgi:hypothetical protein
MGGQFVFLDHYTILRKAKGSFGKISVLTRSTLSTAGFAEPVGTGPETVGTGPTGPDRFRFPTGPNSNFEFKFKKMKKSHKILKNTSRCVESNGVKNFQIFVCLV